jgi:hypothetical protein
MNFKMPPPDGRSILKKKDGMTDDIIREVIDANHEALEIQTESLSRHFSRDKAGMELLWRFVKGEINYEEDPAGVQWIREPARLFADGVGDCKSFTLFICAVLKNLGIAHTIRFCTYNPANQYVTHVYPIAHMPNGETIIMDAVWKRFDEEKTPFYLATNFFFNMNVYRLSGIGEAEAETILKNVADHMTNQSSSLPTYKTDISEMSEREAIAFLTRGNVSGIGSNAAAFNLPVIVMPEESVGKINLKQAVQKVKKVVVTAAKIVTAPARLIVNSVKKLVNWVFQTGLKKAAPFFLFSFIKNTDGLSARVKSKMDKQRKIIYWIAKVTGTSEAVVLASLSQGIQDKYKRTPDEVIANARGIMGVGVIDDIVQFAFSIIKQLVAMFKKTDAPPVDASSASDVNDLRNAPASEQPTAKEVIKSETKVITPETHGEDNKPYDPDTTTKPIIVRNENNSGSIPTQNPPVETNWMMIGAFLLGAYLVFGE